MKFGVRHKIFALLLAIYPIASSARGLREINDWQRTVVDIGRSITASDQSGSAWIVEYNSTFPSTEIGLVLAPASYDRNRSSLNIVATCLPPANASVSTEGRDFASFSANRSVTFDVEAKSPPDFLGGSLSSAGASLAVDRARAVKLNLSDTAVRQVSESDAIDAVNAPECLRRIRHRAEIFYVRGQYLMRLVMTQSRSGGGNVSASLGLTATNKAFGFGIRWNRALDWEIAQFRARPWFRIVSKFRRNGAGSGYEIVQ